MAARVELLSATDGTAVGASITLTTTVDPEPRDFLMVVFAMGHPPTIPADWAEADSADNGDTLVRTIGDAEVGVDPSFTFTWDFPPDITSAWLLHWRPDATTRCGMAFNDRTSERVGNAITFSQSFIDYTPTMMVLTRIGTGDLVAPYSYPAPSTFTWDAALTPVPDPAILHTLLSGGPELGTYVWELALTEVHDEAVFVTPSFTITAVPSDTVVDGGPYFWTWVMVLETIDPITPPEVIVEDVSAQFTLRSRRVTLQELPHQATSTHLGRPL